jgi:DNA-binding transcriptional LysR family regulator
MLDLSLERLRVLIDVHDAGSIVRAAPGDPVRHSQFSRQLRELSGFFGFEVAHRRGKVLKLTDRGTQLAELVRPFLRGLADFREECRNERTTFNVAAGDSLIQWLVIPRLGILTKRLPDVCFNTLNLRTHEIVQQIAEGRVDFGLVRRNAVGAGMKSAYLGKLSYIAVIPIALIHRKATPSFSELLAKYPIAMQATDGQFTKQLRDIAISENVAFRPTLGCQSFPQTLAAVRSGRFAAIIPELALHELPHGSVAKIPGDRLRQLQREIVLMWNPRIIKVRPHAERVLGTMQTTLHFN